MAVKTVLAPIPGIFYRSPSPGEPPFKQDGDTVAAGDTIGLIEVMKTFNPVVAEVGGSNVKFVLDNEDAVMAGQPVCELED